MWQIIKSIFDAIISFYNTRKLKNVDKYTKSEQTRERENLELLDAAYRDGRLKELASQYYDDSDD